MDFVDNYGMNKQEWLSNGPQVGDVVYIRTGEPYGHVAFIKDVDSKNGTIKLKEANWGEDEKIGTRTISINNPNIYGAIRGTVKKQYAGEIKPLPQLSTKNSVQNRQPINTEEFAKALSLL
jgi:CHAP domain.